MCVFVNVVLFCVFCLCVVLWWCFTPCLKVFVSCFFFFVNACLCCDCFVNGVALLCLSVGVVLTFV